MIPKISEPERERFSIQTPIFAQSVYAGPHQCLNSIAQRAFSSSRNSLGRKEDRNERAPAPSEMGIPYPDLGLLREQFKASFTLNKSRLCHSVHVTTQMHPIIGSDDAVNFRRSWPRQKSISSLFLSILCARSCVPVGQTTHSFRFPHYAARGRLA